MNGRSMSKADHLAHYKSKRNFAVTPEPAEGGKQSEHLQYVIQKHWASRLHYDFRLELDGAMKSWAVPKGPSLDPKVKRMAVHVEDHPIAYASFEGTIPPKQYGAGEVIIWDKGYWHPQGNPDKDYVNGHLKFELDGIKLKGNWALVRMKKQGDKQEHWLLIKEKDEFAKSADDYSVVDAQPDSVKSHAFPKSKTRKKKVNEFAQSSEESPESPFAEPSKQQSKALTELAKPPKISVTPELIQALLESTSRAELPAIFTPQLAALAARVPENTELWLAEIKFDGYRLLTRVDPPEVRFFTRNGNDWTNKLQTLQAAVMKLNWPSGWYDGEIVVSNAQGIPDFGALQQSFDSNKTNNIVLYIFDVAYFKGYDVRPLPFIKRRILLTELFTNVDSDQVRLSETYTAAPGRLLKSACQLGLEGLILKRADSSYKNRRSTDWLKLKCKRQQEFLIVGYTPPSGSRSGFGALLLAVYDEHKNLIHVGNVGTGFKQTTLSEIKHKLDSIQIDRSAVSHQFNAPSGSTWVNPILIAEVEFAEWTSSGHIRHAVFKGLRLDKNPLEIVREVPKNLFVDAGDTLMSTSKNSTSLKITHPERVVDPEHHISKLELVNYYQLIADLMFPHIKQRPVSVLRAPGGLSAELFFQKHIDTEKLVGVKEVPQENDKQPLIQIASKQGLAAAAQWNVIEFHTHNSNLSLDLPDRIIFDLDPGEHVVWKQIQEAAQLMHAFLSQLSLNSFLKTSGGKGLHIVVPLKKKYDWDTVKAFSLSIVAHMSKTIPARFVAKSGPKNRVGKIFIDYLRNDQEATTVCAWSLRARSGLGISVPVSWNELMSLESSSQWTIKNVHKRLDRGNAPWDDYQKSAVDISKAMKLLKN